MALDYIFYSIQNTNSILLPLSLLKIHKFLEPSISVCFYENLSFYTLQFYSGMCGGCGREIGLSWWCVNGYVAFILVWVLVCGAMTKWEGVWMCGGKREKGRAKISNEIPFLVWFSIGKSRNGLPLKFILLIFFFFSI